MTRIGSKTTALLLLSAALLEHASAYVSPAPTIVTPPVDLHEKSISVDDTTTLGSLEVPSLGIGTIAWSSDKCKSVFAPMLLILVNNDSLRSTSLLQSFLLKIKSSKTQSHQRTDIGFPFSIQQRVSSCINE